ncbi:zinc-binding dehydrogenase [Streptomyces sp. NPDC046759]|uniref:zinc-binding dehydrogenase n=1 Tax=Streptomyces sp. NPDC046759 TaxID=3155019 RepID=UPI003409A6D0
MLRLTGGRGADVVLDTQGGRALARSVHETAHGGRVVSLAGMALEPSTAETRGLCPTNIAIPGFRLTGRTRAVRRTGWR